MDRFYTRTIHEHYDNDGNHYSRIVVKHSTLEKTCFDYTVKENYEDGSISVITKDTPKVLRETSFKD